MRPLTTFLVALPLLAIGLVAAGAVLLFTQYESTYDGYIYPGVSALGIDLSDETREGATRLLTERASRTTSQPVLLTAPGAEWPHTAGSLGVRMDVEGLVDRAFAVGRQGTLLERLQAIWQLRQGGRSFATLEPDFDPAPLQRTLAEIARQVDRPVVDASLLVTPEAVRVTPAQSGLALDREESFRRVRAALAAGEQRVDLAVIESAPAVMDAHVLPAAERARLLLAAPLVARFGDRSWVVDRAQLYDMLRIQRGPSGAFETWLETAPLEQLAGEIAAELEQAPEDARFEWADGKLDVLRPSRSGQSLDPAEAVDALVAAAFSPDHEVELPVKVVKPAVPVEERFQLGLDELVERSSTSFAGSVEAKKHNIRLAAERINGVVVPPGKVFSFNEAVGPTTLEAGFKWGYAIQGGSSGAPKTIPSVAGGICQVATTLLHSVFWAGYPVEERYPHLYWIPAYTSRDMVGIDTTVDEAAGLDFQFINSTPRHLLIRAWVERDDRLHFALYGTKPNWTVDVQGPTRTNVRPADHSPVTEEDATLPYGQRVAVESARDGFDVLLVRKVMGEGETRTLNLTSRYQPSRNVTLVGTLGRPALARPTPGLSPSPEPSPQSTPGAAETPTTPGAAEATAQPSSGTGASTPEPTPAPPLNQQGTP